MCGIIAYTGKQLAAPVLLQGLRRLEYRGYDSAGIATLSRGRIRTIKAAGKLSALEHKLTNPPSGKIGIGHTRWATHGRPNDLNAHPHVDAANSVALVHNGIIENAVALRNELVKSGVDMTSETDTELLAHLIARQQNDATCSLAESVRLVLQRVRGTYGLAVISQANTDEIVVARNGSPVILGIGQDEMFAASDLAALARQTQQVIHLDDGEIATLTSRGFDVQSLDARPAHKHAQNVDTEVLDYDIGNYKYYMHKEIKEQAESVKSTLRGRLDTRFNTSQLGGLNLEPGELLRVRRIKILGCGSAYYAGLSGANMIETLARIPSNAEPAAEFRYRSPMIEQDTLYIVVSQSGETFDTLAAAREIKRKGGKLLGIINSVGSTIAREVDGGVYMYAGPEISVASTKCYTSMLVVFALLALQLGRIRDLSPQQGAQCVNALHKLPDYIEDTLKQESHIKKIASRYAKSHSAFFIGRTDAYPIALEGAQKLKEISYIHAEAYPASELKHGPLALISNKIPSVVALPDNDLLEKSISTLEEIKSRSGPIIVVTNANHNLFEKLADEIISVPPTHSLLHPIIMAIPLQLFAYHCALALKRDVDQPRNLAKSVTVE